MTRTSGTPIPADAPELTDAPELSDAPGPTVLCSGDGVVSVSLADETLLRSLNDLRWRLAPLIAGGTHTVEIDVSRVDRLSSGSIATLLWVTRTCAARHIRVVVDSPTTRTLDQLRRTGLANVLEIGSQDS